MAEHLRVLGHVGFFLAHGEACGPMPFLWPGKGYISCDISENGGSAMLVLSRMKDESVVVGHVDSLERLVKVTVLEIGREFVRLGFDAHTSVPVNREEVWQRKRSEGQRGPPTTVHNKFESLGNNQNETCFPEPIRDEARGPCGVEDGGNADKNGKDHASSKRGPPGAGKQQRKYARRSARAKVNDT